MSTQFPIEWNVDEILHGILQVYQNPAEVLDNPEVFKESYAVEGVYNDITIRVTIDRKTGKILSGFPTK